MVSTEPIFRSLINADISLVFTAIFKDISPSLASVQEAISGNGTVIIIVLGVVAITSFIAGLAFGRRRNYVSNSEDYKFLPEYDPASPPTQSAICAARASRWKL